MDFSLWLEYGWALIILIGLEGILAADNAVVMAVMVKHLPLEKQKKALFYGLAGAVILRLISLFFISYFINVWQIQAAGACYLIFLSIHHFIKKSGASEKKGKQGMAGKPFSFWGAVVKVELADVVFAIDSMLAAAAIAVTLKPAGWFEIGGLDAGPFLVMFIGGAAGLILIRFAANSFIKILQVYPVLETAAFLIVGWVGIKLAVHTLAHPSVSILSEDFPSSAAWKLVFWCMLIGIAATGGIMAKKSKRKISEGV